MSKSDYVPFNGGYDSGTCERGVDSENTKGTRIRRY